VPFVHRALARHRRVRGVTPTRLTDCGADLRVPDKSESGGCSPTTFKSFNKSHAFSRWLPRPPSPTAPCAIFYGPSQCSLRGRHSLILPTFGGHAGRSILASKGGVRCCVVLHPRMEVHRALHRASLASGKCRNHGPNRSISRTRSIRTLELSSRPCPISGLFKNDLNAQQGQKQH
jgi:hypothetical protein